LILSSKLVVFIVDKNCLSAEALGKAIFYEHIQSMFYIKIIIFFDKWALVLEIKKV